MRWFFFDNRAEFMLASVETTQRTPKKVTFADRIAKSHEDRITEHLKTGAEQTITVATQHDAFDQLFNDVSDSDSFIDMSDNDSDEHSDNTVMASEDSLNGFDGISLTTNMSGASSLFNKCTLFNGKGTSTHPLDNELRDTSSSKANELTLDASIPAELDGSFDQSNNELFKKQDGKVKDTLLSRWQEHQRVGPREHNPNMFCEDCRVYGHTQDKCARNQAIESLNQWHARSNKSDEPDNCNNGQDQESECQESENIFPIDIDQDELSTRTEGKRVPTCSPQEERRRNHYSRCWNQESTDRRILEDHQYVHVLKLQTILRNSTKTRTASHTHTYILFNFIIIIRSG